MGNHYNRLGESERMTIMLMRLKGSTVSEIRIKFTLTPIMLTPPITCLTCGVHSNLRIALRQGDARADSQWVRSRRAEDARAPIV